MVENRWRSNKLPFLFVFAILLTDLFQKCQAIQFNWKCITYKKYWFLIGCLVGFFFIRLKLLKYQVPRSSRNFYLEKLVFEGCRNIGNVQKSLFKNVSGSRKSSKLIKNLRKSWSIFEAVVSTGKNILVL